MDKQYELFAAWWNEPQQDELRKSCASGWGWKIWQASRQQQSATAAPGWRLVPEEPTRQMMSQGHFAMAGTDRGKFRRIYMAMVAAAPEVGK